MFCDICISFLCLSFPDNYIWWIVDDGHRWLSGNGFLFLLAKKIFVDIYLKGCYGIGNLWCNSRDGLCVIFRTTVNYSEQYWPNIGL